MRAKAMGVGQRLMEDSTLSPPALILYEMELISFFEGSKKVLNGFDSNQEMPVAKPS